MCQIRQFLPVVVILLVGCATSPTAKLTADYPNEQAQIRLRLSEIFDAAKKNGFSTRSADSNHGLKPTHRDVAQTSLS